MEGSEQMSVLSPPVYGYFHSPWKSAVLRRDEVMLREGRVAGPGKVEEWIDDEQRQGAVYPVVAARVDRADVA